MSTVQLVGWAQEEERDVVRGKCLTSFCALVFNTFCAGFIKNVAVCVRDTHFTRPMERTFQEKGIQQKHEVALLTVQSAAYGDLAGPSYLHENLPFL